MDFYSRGILDESDAWVIIDEILAENFSTHSPIIVFCSDANAVERFAGLVETGADHDFSTCHYTFMSENQTMQQLEDAVHRFNTSSVNLAIISSKVEIQVERKLTRKAMCLISVCTRLTNMLQLWRDSSFAYFHGFSMPRHIHVILWYEGYQP